MYSSPIYFHLPGLFRFYTLYSQLITLYNTHREYFYDNVNIGSIYGSPSAIWNGGRLILSTKPEIRDLIAIRNFMKFNHIPVRFTFTNSLLEERHLNDDYCNEILKIFNTGNNEIICNSPILENYIRSNYGNNYKYISSTTKCIRDPHKLEKELEKEYYLTVLDYNFNNTDTINNINNKSSCEILCNPVCTPNCSRRALHYQDISKCQILGVCGNFKCNESGSTFAKAQESPLFVSKDLIESKYIPLGYKQFKLEGRTARYFDLVEILNYYLIKPEYGLLFRENLMLLNINNIM